MSVIDNPQPIVPVSHGPLAAPAPASPAAPAAAGEGGGLTAKDIWRVITQQKLLIIITFTVVYLLVVAATLLTYKYAPAFYNEAYVSLIPPVKAWKALEEEVPSKDNIETQQTTHANRIRNDQLLLEVLALPEIKQTRFYRWYGENFDKCLHDLKKMLVVAPIKDSMHVRVGIAVQDRKEAKLIVNKVVERYIARSRSTQTDINRERLETLKGTQAAVRGDLDKLRDQIKAVRADRDMPAIEADQQVNVETTAILSNTLNELATRMADLDAQLATVNGVDPRQLPLSAEMRLIIEMDPFLRYYRQQVEAFDIQMQVLKENRMGENNRQFKEIKSQREGIAYMEVARREELIHDLRERQIESLQQEKARLANMQETVYERLHDRQLAQRDLDSAIQKYRELIKDEDRMSKQLEQIGLALREAETAMETQRREGRLDPIFATRDPYFPSRPNFLVFLGGGFVLAGLLSVGLALLREVTDQAIRTPIDVARYGRLPVLGAVPMLDEEEAELESIELATRRAPQSLVAEAFRQIRANLTFSGPIETQRVLLITSAGSEEGKTATTVNLGVAFAQANQRVLLIDCNFRRPAVRNSFPSARPEGLSNVLVGQSRLEQAISRTEVPLVDVLTAGPMPPNPAELLGSPQMRALLESARKVYDRVLLDGPPALLISDALVLATQVDAVVLVSRANVGTKGALRRAREQLQRLNVRVIGAILNGVVARAGGYYRKQYREFYDYTNEQVVPQELAAPLAELESGAVSDPDDDLNERKS